jgi:hypothetical protein
MWGNKSPTPPVFCSKLRGIKPRKNLMNDALSGAYNAVDMGVCLYRYLFLWRKIMKRVLLAVAVTCVMGVSLAFAGGGQQGSGFRRRKFRFVF